MLVLYKRQKTITDKAPITLIKQTKRGKNKNCQAKKGSGS
jgi:hypothetical protein